MGVERKMGEGPVCTSAVLAFLVQNHLSQPNDCCRMLASQ
jgi:hypothetical protein